MVNLSRRLCTIYVKEEEWLKVGTWVYDHFEDISGLSFLPYTDHVYQQAPYQELTKEEYDEWCKKMPKIIDWDKLTEYEKYDTTTASKEYACSSGTCELI